MHNIIRLCFGYNGSRSKSHRNSATKAASLKSVAPTLSPSHLHKNAEATAAFVLVKSGCRIERSDNSRHKSCDAALGADTQSGLPAALPVTSVYDTPALRRALARAASCRLDSGVLPETGDGCGVADILALVEPRLLSGSAAHLAQFISGKGTHLFAAYLRPDTLKADQQPATPPCWWHHAVVEPVLWDARDGEAVAAVLVTISLAETTPAEVATPAIASTPDLDGSVRVQGAASGKGTDDGSSSNSVLLAGVVAAVTAFSVDGAQVLQQNHISLQCYGDRAAQLPVADGNTGPTTPLLLSPEDPSALGVLGAPHSLLDEIFCLEPAKLGRLWQEVAVQGRVWRGIVKVPAAFGAGPKADTCASEFLKQPPPAAKPVSAAVRLPPDAAPTAVQEVEEPHHPHFPARQPPLSMALASGETGIQNVAPAAASASPVRSMVLSIAGTTAASGGSRLLSAAAEVQPVLSLSVSGSRRCSQRQPSPLAPKCAAASSSHQQAIVGTATDGASPCHGPLVAAGGSSNLGHNSEGNSNSDNMKGGGRIVGVSKVRRRSLLSAVRELSHDDDEGYLEAAMVTPDEAATPGATAAEAVVASAAEDSASAPMRPPMMSTRRVSSVLLRSAFATTDDVPLLFDENDDDPADCGSSALLAGSSALTTDMDPLATSTWRVLLDEPSHLVAATTPGCSAGAGSLASCGATGSGGLIGDGPCGAAGLQTAPTTLHRRSRQPNGPSNSRHRFVKRDAAARHLLLASAAASSSAGIGPNAPTSALSLSAAAGGSQVLGAVMSHGMSMARRGSVELLDMAPHDRQSGDGGVACQQTARDSSGFRGEDRSTCGTMMAAALSGAATKALDLGASQHLYQHLSTADRAAHLLLQPASQRAQQGATSSSDAPAADVSVGGLSAMAAAAWPAPPQAANSCWATRTGPAAATSSHDDGDRDGGGQQLRNSTTSRVPRRGAPRRCETRYDLRDRLGAAGNRDHLGAAGNEKNNSTTAAIGGASAASAAAPTSRMLQFASSLLDLQQRVGSTPFMRSCTTAMHVSSLGTTAPEQCARLASPSPPSPPMSQSHARSPPRPSSCASCAPAHGSIHAGQPYSRTSAAAEGAIGTHGSCEHQSLAILLAIPQPPQVQQQGGQQQAAAGSNYSNTEASVTTITRTVVSPISDLLGDRQLSPYSSIQVGVAAGKLAAVSASSLRCRPVASSTGETTSIGGAGEESTFVGQKTYTAHQSQLPLVTPQPSQMQPSRRAGPAQTSTAAAAGSGGGTTRWHEMTASRVWDSATRAFAIVLMQVDVTAKVEAERHIAHVTEAEHRLLEQIFPRHVLAYMTQQGGPWSAAAAQPADAQTPPPASVFQQQIASVEASQPLHLLHGAWRPVVRDINQLATRHDACTLLFADIQGFTPMCKVLDAQVVMAFLNDLFSRFDRRLDEFGVYKVETIGDCYFVAGGLMHEDQDGMAAVRARESNADPDHAHRVFAFAQAMLEAASRVKLPTTGGPVRMRVGLHTGPVVSGVVGRRMPRFTVYGDTVNTASRMESTGKPGYIHVSESTYELLRRDVDGWVPTGGIEVKGKGRMHTYLWALPGAELEPEVAAPAVE